MSNNIKSIILAAGLTVLAYKYIGSRIGYSGNTAKLWTVLGSVFVVGYLISIITFTWLIHT